MGIIYLKPHDAKYRPEAEEIEVTPEMIEAGSRVIWRNELVDIGPSGCWTLAMDVLKAALEARSSRNCVALSKYDQLPAHGR